MFVTYCSFDFNIVMGGMCFSLPKFVISIKSEADNVAGI